MKNNQLPVSGKFYNDISLRVNSALSTMPLSAAEAMRIVDSYMAGETPESGDPMAMLAFNMVRVEIDRAMKRSQRARERARVRKNGTKTEPLHLTDKFAENKKEDVTDSAPVPVRHKSRRERRAIQNQIRRLKKARWGAIQ